MQHRTGENKEDKDSSTSIGNRVSNCNRATSLRSRRDQRDKGTCIGSGVAVNTERRWPDGAWPLQRGSAVTGTVTGKGMGNSSAVMASDS